MDEKRALEDLAYIKQIIDESKQSIVFGADFIVWGIIIAISLIATYIMIYIPESHPYIKWMWIFTICCGWIYSYINGRMEAKSCGPQTFIDKAVSKLWVATGISATMVGLIGMFFNTFGGNMISPIIASIIAIAYFTTGELMKNKLFRYLAAGWWLSSLVMFIFPGIYSILIMAGTLILFQVIPGIYLRKQTMAQLQD